MTENALIQHQSLTILQRIDELKNWRRQQQQKLASKGTPSSKDSFAEKGLVKDKTVKPTSIIQSDNNIQHTSKPMLNIDEMPIKVANPNFIEVIENNVAANEMKENQTEQLGEKPKFKFLRKGEGIARFHMGPRKSPNKYGSKSVPSIPSLKLSKDTEKNKFNEENQPVAQHDPTPETIPNLEPPNLKLDLTNWKNVFNNEEAIQKLQQDIDNNELEMFQSDYSLDSTTASIMERIIAVGKKQLKEKEELRVFEAIEQHVSESNTSFCSTSSYVAKLMENAIMSTPVKDKFSKNNSNTTSQSHQLSTNTLNQLKVHENVLPNRTVSPVWTTRVNKPNNLDQISESGNLGDEMDSEQSLHVRFAEKVDCKSFVEYSQSLNSTNHNDVNEKREFNDSEEWKEESEEESRCSSECSTRYSSSDEDIRPISPPVKHPIQRCEPCLTTHETDLQNRIKKLDIKDLKTTIPSDEHTSTQNYGSDIFPPILSAKLMELKREIEVFRAENRKLAAVRESLEKEHKKIQLEKKKMLKEMEDEKKKNLDLLEEEKQKFAKEKLVFEKYSKLLTKNPTKEERKEIQALKEQLREIKEELNKKESRWGAAQARVRNQVKLLEEDNKKLREEVEVLRKQSKSLEILTQRRKGRGSNNTKFIHAINDHISSIDVEIENTNSKGPTPYFKAQSDNQESKKVDEIDNTTLRTVKVIKETGPLKTRNSENNEINQKSKISLNTSADNSVKVNTEPEINSTVNKLPEDKHPSNPPVEIPQSCFVDDLVNNPNKEVVMNDSIEITHPDGKKEIRYKNGNIKKYDPISGSEKIIYFNGDVKEITSNGTIKYYFSESRIWHTTLPDGFEVLDFPNGQVEKRYNNGTVEITYPNNCKKLMYTDGSEEVYYADGTILRVEDNKKKILSLPNGQKEIHTDECIRREFPDGTVKVVFPDGATETVYSNGRVRKRDKHGNLVMDSGTLKN